MLSVFVFSATALPAFAAGPCGVLCNAEFYETATPASVEQLVAEGEDVNGKDPMGRSPLHFAGGARADTIRALIAAGADVSAPDSLDRKPIHFVTAAGSPENVVVLLKAGADPNARTANNWTPLHGVAKWGRPEIIRVLLEAGADPGATNDMGETPFDLVGNNTQVLESPEFHVLKEAKTQ